MQVHSPYYQSKSYGNASSFCYLSECYGSPMDLPELLEYRKQRLQALVELRYEDNKAALGHAMGFKDGAYISQMLNGRRPITEKAIEKFELLPGAANWFAPPTDGPQMVASAPHIAHAIGSVPVVLAFASMLKTLSETQRKYMALLLSDLALQPDKAPEIAPEIARLLQVQQPGKSNQPRSTNLTSGNGG